MTPDTGDVAENLLTALDFAPVPAPPLKVFDLMYGGARPENVIAFGSVRPARAPLRRLGQPKPPSLPGAEARAKQRKRRKKKQEPYLHALSGIRIGERETWFEAVLEYCVGQTLYFMPNPLRPSALGHPLNKEESERLEAAENEVQSHCLRWVGARNSNVAELASIALDIDCYKVGLKPTAVLMAVLDLADEGTVPRPSMVAYSGRGAYVYWLLGGGYGGLPVANGENVAAWRRVVSHLADATLHLGADRNAMRPANWFKSPGSVCTKTGRDVLYMPLWPGATGEVPRYTLEALVDALGITHQRIEPVERPAVIQPRSRRKPEERKRKAKLGRGGECARKRVREIERLSDYRGGFVKGIREEVMWLYYCHLHGARYAAAEDTPEARSKATREVVAGTRKLASKFRPRLPESRVRAKINAFTKSHQSYRFCNATLADKLNVTEAEVEALGLESIVPAHVAQARARAKAAAKAQREAEKVAQHERIKALIAAEMSDKRIAAQEGVARATVAKLRRTIQAPAQQEQLFEGAVRGVA